MSAFRFTERWVTMLRAERSEQAIDVLVSREHRFADVGGIPAGEDAVDFAEHPLTGGQHLVEFTKGLIKGVAAAKCCQ